VVFREKLSPLAIFINGLNNQRSDNCTKHPKKIMSLNSSELSARVCPESKDLLDISKKDFNRPSSLEDRIQGISTYFASVCDEKFNNSSTINDIFIMVRDIKW